MNYFKVQEQWTLKHEIFQSTKSMDNLSITNLSVGGINVV